MELRGKKILFFSAHFFGYNKYIVEAMEQMGAIVDFYDERPNNNFMVKAVIRLYPKAINRYIKRYHNAIIEKAKSTDYDYVFFIKAESITLESLKKLRASQSKATFILYLWDSFLNFRNGVSKMKFFDRVLSFDRYECEKYNMIFRPLFYIDKYKKIASSDVEKDIDLLFIGTIHSDRYNFLTQIKTDVQRYNKKVLYYLFFMSRILYYKMKLTNSALRGTKSSNFQFIPLSQDDIIAFFCRSKVIIDIQHANQTGLTMRTIETLGAKRKLITTNQDIKKYNFYNPNNIMIVDRKNPKIDIDFINSNYQNINSDIYNYYSIEEWIKIILENE